MGGATPSTLEPEKIQERAGSLHRQNQVVFEELRATKYFHISRKNV